MPASQKRYVWAGSWIDGSGAPAKKNVLLTVENGLITAINDRRDAVELEGAVVDDLSHCTLVPPLVDCNLTLARSPAIDLRQHSSLSYLDSERQVAMMQRHIRYLHDHGVLGAVDCDTDRALIDKYRTMAAGNALVSLCSPFQSRANFTWMQVSSEIASNDRQQSRELIGNLKQKSQQYQGKKIVVLANGPEAVARALEAGCAAVVQGYGMGEQNLQKMAAEGVLWIPSLILAKNGRDSSGSGGDVCCRFSLRYVAPGQAKPGAENYWQELLAEQIEQLRRARDLGVLVATGTGAGSSGIIHGESVIEEIKLFIKAGYTLEEALRSASEIGAGFFGMEQIGALRVGHPATFLVTRGTPKQLPRKLAYLENIYVRGVPSATYRKNPVKVVHQRSVPHDRQPAS